MVSDIHHAQRASDDVAGVIADTAINPGVLLFTPAQAAALLQVRESWLRRGAAARRVPCSFVGKHLRFSRDDLDAIIAASARPARTPSGSRRSRRYRDRPSH